MSTKKKLPAKSEGDPNSIGVQSKDNDLRPDNRTLCTEWDIFDMVVEDIANGIIPDVPEIDGVPGVGTVEPDQFPVVYYNPSARLLVLQPYTELRKPKGVYLPLAIPPDGNPDSWLSRILDQFEVEVIMLVGATIREKRGPFWDWCDSKGIELWQY